MCRCRGDYKPLFKRTGSPCLRRKGSISCVNCSRGPSLSSTWGIENFVKRCCKIWLNTLYYRCVCLNMVSLICLQKLKIHEKKSKRIKSTVCVAVLPVLAKSCSSNSRNSLYVWHRTIINLNVSWNKCMKQTSRQWWCYLSTSSLARLVKNRPESPWRN
jgi:hypothetical protein